MENRDINGPSLEMEEVLSAASENGNLSVVRALLNQNAASQGWAPLRVMGIMRPSMFLLDRGTNICAVNLWGI